MCTQNISIRIFPLYPNYTGMTQIEEYVIAQVKKMREEKGWSQQALADYMDLSQSFIKSIENPKHRAKYNLNHINKLAEIFQCSPQDFLPEKPFPTE